jgi:choline dehydrogenase
MVYIRGQKEDYDEWARLPGCEGWSYEELLPYFKRSENFESGPADHFHGKGGELNVTRSRVHYPLNDVYLEAAKAAGFPRNDDFNGPSQEGVGLFHINQKNGKRLSSARAFLGEAEKRPNLEIVTEARACKILFHNKTRAVGVEYVDKKGEKIEAAAMSEVILSAGAFASPHLLELSGVGSRKVLEAQGIELVNELDGVGENLQDHYTVMVQHGVTGGKTLAQDGRFPGIIFSVLKYLFAKKGLLAHPAAAIGAFLKGSTPDGKLDERPAYQIHFAAGNGEWDDKGNMIPGETPGVTSTCCVLRPESRGTVHINSADPKKWSAVQFNYLSAEEDRRRIVEAVKLQREIYAAKPFADIATEEQKPGTAVSSDEEILDYCRQQGMSVYHPVGTCKMGRREDEGVVDNRLKVHGLEALRVVDGSIFPNLLSGNTHAPIVAVAEKAAEMILQDRMFAKREAWQGMAPKGIAEGGDISKCPFHSGG